MSDELFLRPGWPVMFRPAKGQPWVAATVKSVVGSTVMVQPNEAGGLLSLNLDDPADLDCIGPPF
jgi:hypothetical protein